MPDVSLVVVNYRTATLAREAFASARSSCSSAIEIIAVDNSESEVEASELRSAGADLVIAPPRNLGYGSGVNLGASNATGSVLIASNPDVIFHPGSIDALIAATDGQSIAGPALFWDRGCRWQLPPADLPSVRQKIAQLRATRNPRYARRRDAARTRARVRFWSLDATTEVDAVSGAVMAIPRRLFDRAGGFDERYFLYYEEMDLVRSVRRLGGRVLYVPSSRCTHLYNQSAALSPAAAGHFSRSEEIYLRKWNGESLVRILQAYGKPLPDFEPFTPASRGETLVLDGIEPGRAVVEASSLSTFETAAGTFSGSREVTIPPDILHGYSAPMLYVRATEKNTGRVVRAWSIAM